MASESKTAAPIFHIKVIDPFAKDLYAQSSTNSDDSGIDLRFPVTQTIIGTRKVSFGVGIQCFVGKNQVPFDVVPRSSISKTPLIFELGSLGIEANGEISVVLKNISDEAFKIERGTSLFQAVDKYLRPPKSILVKELSQGPLKNEKLRGRIKKYLWCVNDSVRKFYDGHSTVLCVPEDIRVGPKTTVAIKFGVRTCCTLDGTSCAYMLKMLPKEDLRMHNIVGIIDRGYRGELQAKICNTSSSTERMLKRGEELFYLVSPVPAEKTYISFVDGDHDEFKEGATVRGAGGFGSTGAGGKK